MSLWAVTMASGIEARRLEVVLGSWAHARLDGICIVIGEHDPRPPMVAIPTRIVRTAAPFSRATWRNIAVRYAPAERVIALDADCVVLDPEFTFYDRVIEGLGAASARRLVACTFSWGSEEGATALLEGGQLPAGGWGAFPMPKAGTTGQLAFWRKDAIEVSWDDTMVGWGAEDTDLHWRAEAAGFASVWVEGCIGHVWHPLRRGVRPRSDRVANLGRARERRAAPPDVERAVREISMQPLAVSHLEGATTDAKVRHAVRLSCEAAGWPALTQLAAGHEPERCTYALVRGVTVEDRPPLAP